MGVEHLKDSATTKANVTTLLLLDSTTGELHGLWLSAPARSARYTGVRFVSSHAKCWKASQHAVRCAELRLEAGGLHHRRAAWPVAVCTRTLCTLHWGAVRFVSRQVLESLTTCSTLC